MTDAEYQAKYGWFEGDFTGIKSDARVKKYAEVYTPRWVAEKMLDAIPDDGAADIEATVCEPACGEGAFLTCVLRRKPRNHPDCAAPYDLEQKKKRNARGQLRAQYIRPRIAGQAISASTYYYKQTP